MELKSKLELIKRERCVICEGESLLELFRLEDFPVYMGSTSASQLEDIKADQIWGKCENCGCLQLLKLIPLEILYGNNHHSEPVGEIWKNHHIAFGEFISLYNLELPIEIGGAHCHLAEIIKAKFPDCDYTVIEPAPTRIPENVKVIRDFAENQATLISKANPLIHSHVLEHLYSPRTFFEFLGNATEIGTQSHISIPNIPRLISTFGANSLNFEHTYYLDKQVLNFLALQSGFEIVNTKPYLEHSIFFSLRNNGGSKVKPQAQKLCDESSFLFMHESIRRFTANVTLELRNLRGNAYLFGAHVFSQIFLHYGLPEQRISAVLDNANSKINKRLYGSGLLVKHPSELIDDLNPIVILCASHYQSEIKNQILNINPGTIFLEM